jgi:hypothetical protein
LPIRACVELVVLRRREVRRRTRATQVEKQGDQRQVRGNDVTLIDGDPVRKALGVQELVAEETGHRRLPLVPTVGEVGAATECQLEGREHAVAEGWKRGLVVQLARGNDVDVLDVEGLVGIARSGEQQGA